MIDWCGFRWGMDPQRSKRQTRFTAGNTSILTIQSILSHPMPQQLTRHFPSSFLKNSTLMLFQSTKPLSDNPTLRSVNAIPPLLQCLTERNPENLDYLGVSYGLTPQLLQYSTSFLISQFSIQAGSGSERAGYVPLYIR